MSLFKKKITLVNAIDTFLFTSLGIVSPNILSANVKDNGPEGMRKVVRSIIDSYKEINTDFDEEAIDFEVAIQEYAIFLTAFDLLSLENIFPKEQSKRILSLIFEKVAQSVDGKIRIQRLNKYWELFHGYIGKVLPWRPVIDELLTTWFKKKTEIDMDLYMAVNIYMTNSPSFWLNIRNNFKIHFENE